MLPDLFSGATGGGRQPWYRNHDLCVDKVYRYLRRKCGSKVEIEISLSPGRRTDVYGFNSKTNTFYICEIKVDWSDAQKAEWQLDDTCSYMRKQYKKATIVPVLAMPINLQDELKEYGNWQQAHARCSKSGIKIWIIPYRGTIRQLR